MANLTEHDINVLAKIKDPEANVVNRAKIDGSLAPDPHVTGNDYEAAKGIELDAIREVAKKDRFGFPVEPVSEIDGHSIFKFGPLTVLKFWRHPSQGSFILNSESSEVKVINWT